jgi:hypothetical protein
MWLPGEPSAVLLCTCVRRVVKVQGVLESGDVLSVADTRSKRKGLYVTQSIDPWRDFNHFSLISTKS